MTQTKRKAPGRARDTKPPFKTIAPEASVEKARIRLTSKSEQPASLACPPLARHPRPGRRHQLAASVPAAGATSPTIETPAILRTAYTRIGSNEDCTAGRRHQGQQPGCLADLFPFGWPTYSGEQQEHRKSSMGLIQRAAGEAPNHDADAGRPLHPERHVNQASMVGTGRHPLQARHRPTRKIAGATMARAIQIGARPANLIAEPNPAAEGTVNR